MAKPHSRKFTPSVCQQCGVAYLARQDGRGVYCSRACTQQSVRDRAPSRIACPCEVCGSVRMVKPSVVADGKGKYCSKACRAIGIATHGDTRGGSHSTEYMAWTSIKTRCLNPVDQHYPLYGGRGITICVQWRDSFEQFLADVGRRPSPQHSIDRIDNNGPYSPENVTWSTSLEQARNRRTNRLVTFEGVTMCVTDWAASTGLKVNVLCWRLDKGWDVARALTTPRRRTTRSRQPPTIRGSASIWS